MKIFCFCSGCSQFLPNQLMEKKVCRKFLQMQQLRYHFIVAFVCLYGNSKKDYQCLSNNFERPFRFNCFCTYYGLFNLLSWSVECKMLSYLFAMKDHHHHTFRITYLNHQICGQHKTFLMGASLLRELEVGVDKNLLLASHRCRTFFPTKKRILHIWNFIFLGKSMWGCKIHQPHKCVNLQKQRQDNL